MQTVQIRLPTELYENFRELSNQRGREVSTLIRHAAMVGYFKIKDKDAPKKEAERKS